MKKITSIIFIAILAFTITGCGNKNAEVTCTKDKEKITISFKGNKIAKYVGESTTNYATEAFANSAYQTYQMTVSAYNSMKGITAETQKNGKEIYLKLTFNIEDMDQETLKDSDLIKKRDVLIEELEKSGYTCK